MGDYLLKHLRGGISRFREVGQVKKKNSVFIAIILMLAMGIFFCIISENYAYADKSSNEYSQFTSFRSEYVESISEFRDIDLNWENGLAKDQCQTSRANLVSKTNLANIRQMKPAKVEVYSIKEVIRDKMGTMGDLIEKRANSQAELSKSSCIKHQKTIESQASNQRENKILELVIGYPIEEMLSYIAARDERVAYYLVAIAKKESNWGKHSPLKNGSTCYNYWGYRGAYKQTDSGYSCFDSPEQAIAQVGDRIESLIDKNIDTPEKLIVWKCGSTCAGHDPQGVLKWISDVKLYYRKLST